MAEESLCLICRNGVKMRLYEKVAGVEFITVYVYCEKIQSVLPIQILHIQGQDGEGDGKIFKCSHYEAREKQCQ